MLTSTIPFERQQKYHPPFAQQTTRSLLLSRADASGFQTHVNIRLQPEDLASVRFAVSPLWECIAAFRAWMNPTPPALLAQWRARVSKTLLDLGVLL